MNVVVAKVGGEKMEQRVDLMAQRKKNGAIEMSFITSKTILLT